MSSVTNTANQREGYTFTHKNSRRTVSSITNTANQRGEQRSHLQHTETTATHTAKERKKDFSVIHGQPARRRGCLVPNTANQRGGQGVLVHSQSEKGTVSSQPNTANQREGQ